MGRITCANVMSDLYAMGVTQIDSVDMMLKISEQMSFDEQKVITPLLIKGFKNAAEEANTPIRNLTVVYNPWCTIGGIASAVCANDEYILPFHAEVGDLLVLTKPLGTQIACAAQTPNRWSKIESITTREELKSLLDQASRSMGRLNRVAALLMHKYEAHASTDVTGFGLLGHAENLARHQVNEVAFVINKLPIMKNALKIAKALGIGRLINGISPETSGGLLIALSKDKAGAFCEEITNLEGFDCWIVGFVEKGLRTARLDEQIETVEVPF